MQRSSVEPNLISEPGQERNVLHVLAAIAHVTLYWYMPYSLLAALICLSVSTWHR